MRQLVDPSHRTPSCPAILKRNRVMTLKPLSLFLSARAERDTSPDHSPNLQLRARPPDRSRPQAAEIQTIARGTTSKNSARVESLRLSERAIPRNHSTDVIGYADAIHRVVFLENADDNTD
jgi:hypothetical protein